MNRLTKTYRNKTYKIFGVADDLPCGENSYDFKNLLIQKLGEYEDLEEQGLLIKLPCKVGDTVYYVNLSNKVINYMVSGFKVDCFGNLQINVARHLESGYFLDMQLGKTVFLTREEAEKAMEVENE